MPSKPPKRGRLRLLKGSCVRLRAERANHVWSCDFVHHRSDDGRAFHMFNVLEAFTRASLAIRVRRKLSSGDVIDVLADLFMLRGVPARIRSDRGVVDAWIDETIAPCREGFTFLFDLTANERFFLDGVLDRGEIDADLLDIVPEIRVRNGDMPMLAWKIRHVRELRGSDAWRADRSSGRSNAWCVRTRSRLRTVSLRVPAYPSAVPALRQHPFRRVGARKPGGPPDLEVLHLSPEIAPACAVRAWAGQRPRRS